MSSEETQKIISYLRGQLIGPADGQFERLKAAANTRYLVGMLFPQDMETEDAFDLSTKPGPEGILAPGKSPAPLL